MTASAAILILAMPGFGSETLRHLVRSPQWPGGRVQVGLIGARPPAWRRAAGWLRRQRLRPEDRLHRLADGGLAACDAERLLGALGIGWRWLESDDAVRAWRAVLRPALTLTITSRILFSARTLEEAGGDWFNVHPGLLPEYAGASPAPYMFADGIGGCTIHRMVAAVDAGPIVDRAPMAGGLGDDGGEYFYARLSAHTAARVAALLQRWADGEALAGQTIAGQPPRRHFTSRRLAVDRRLDWRWSASRIERWVRALAGIAPAWWIDARGRRFEVLAAQVLTAHTVDAAAGTVHACRGRWIAVACAGGAVALRCRAQPRVPCGTRLPLPEGAIDR